MKFVKSDSKNIYNVFWTFNSSKCPKKIDQVSILSSKIVFNIDAYKNVLVTFVVLLIWMFSV